MPSTFTIKLIKCEKDAIESKISVSKKKIPNLIFRFLLYKVIMDILIKLYSTRTKLGSTSF